MTNTDRCIPFFFFQAEDGIRDVAVTGVQTCALPISACASGSSCARCVVHTTICERARRPQAATCETSLPSAETPATSSSAFCGKRVESKIGRGRVGKECRSRWSPYHDKKNRDQMNVR